MSFLVFDSISASQTVHLNGNGYLIDAAAGDLLLTLPDIAANGGDGLIMYFKRTDNNVATLVTLAAAVAGQTFDDSPTFRLRCRRCIQIIANGNKWHIISAFDN